MTEYYVDSSVKECIDISESREDMGITDMT